MHIQSYARRSEDTIWELVLSLLHVGLEDQTLFLGLATVTLTRQAILLALIWALSIDRSLHLLETKKQAIASGGKDSRRETRNT